jgi:hypothetical protein
MSKKFPAIEPQHRDFIGRQHVFFVASATASGRVNVSPKGLDAFRMIDANKVVYLDRTGSGNETSAHLRADGRLTIMFCAFEGAPLILRLYGRGTAHWRGCEGYRALLTESFASEEPAGARQIVTLDIDLVQTSCGFGVPLFDYREERPSLTRWAEAQAKRRSRLIGAKRTASASTACRPDCCRKAKTPELGAPRVTARLVDARSRPRLPPPAPPTSPSSGCGTR